MIKGIAHVCIGSTDLDATERFYCSGLGFTKAFRFVRGGQAVGYYLKVSEGTYIEVFLRSEVDRQAAAPISHICLEARDLAELALATSRPGV